MEDQSIKNDHNNKSKRPPRHYVLNLEEKLNLKDSLDLWLSGGTEYETESEHEKTGIEKYIDIFSYENMSKITKSDKIELLRKTSEEMINEYYTIDKYDKGKPYRKIKLSYVSHGKDKNN